MIGLTKYQDDEAPFETCQSCSSSEDLRRLRVGTKTQGMAMNLCFDCREELIDKLRDHTPYRFAI